MRATWQSQVRAEPRVRVEAVPEPQRPLERLAGEILGDEAVAREPDEVAVDVVEVALGGLRERVHVVHTPRASAIGHTRVRPDGRHSPKWSELRAKAGVASGVAGAAGRPSA